jgi:hypothetical protein
MGKRATGKETNRTSDRLWLHPSRALEKIRIEGIRRCDTGAVILQLQDAFESAQIHNPPKATSGLIEQQRLFQRLSR